jgi:hypothetical protein
MKNKLFTLCLFVLSLQSSIAQKNIANQQHAWAMYTGNHRLSEKWGIHTEYQFRRADGFNDWQQSLLRLGVDYYANASLQLTAGYGLITSFAYGEQPIAHETTENRIWEQVIFTGKLGRIELQHRYRLEQRFIENWEKDTDNTFYLDGFLFRQRIRYRLLLTMPLSRKSLENNTLFLSVYDEPFLGFGAGIGENILDQNRLYLALGWRFTKDFNVQLGYLNQYIVKANGIDHERNHTLQIGLTYNLNLRKSKK